MAEKEKDKEKKNDKETKKSDDQEKKAKNKKKKRTEEVLPTSTPVEVNDQEERLEDKPFELQGLKIKITKGSFVAIVGRVGSGKSSLLQAMIGEMRKTRGEVRIQPFMAVLTSSLARAGGVRWRCSVCSTERVD